ncbi:CBM_collapsed_G0001780.mRNA.1.CDS.1 [Saccharomyces cerevisiae]|nr:CBM_collapsed_G0001780.mRNA.1.CDS.1 [Saccharomyces cerevisiae]
MAGQVLDGKACAQQFRSNIANEIKSIQGHVPGFAPNLAIIQVGNRPDSATYVRMKRKAAEEAGIVANFIHLDESATEFEVLRFVDQLNEDPHTHGIIVQLPLPAHLDEDRITSRVLAEKDVDGFGPTNIGELNKKNGHPFFLPCTPKGIIELLHKANVTIEGSRSVVIGRSDIVGSPVAELLKSLNSYRHHHSF